jgi:uncharacterized protein involved in type VI secretion and phage assembly
MGGLSVDVELTEQLVEWVRSRYFGKYRGVVSDNADQTSRGRLKVKVPAVLGALEVWALPCVPYAGKGVGFYSLPEVGAGVWVEFEAGDPSFPIWTGCFWADGELPDAGGAPIKIWKTEKLKIRLDDGNDQALIEATSGSKVEVAADVISESGGAKHAVGSSGVVGEAGASKLEITSASILVNDGALEVV